MAEIYQDVALGRDELIGRITADGKVYDTLPDSGEYLGWIDYENGEVYDSDDTYMGWVEENGEIFGSYDEGDECLGYVETSGKLYMYDLDDNEIYVGQVTDMTDVTEGAAAVLFFFDEVEEDEEEEDES